MPSPAHGSAFLHTAVRLSSKVVGAPAAATTEELVQILDKSVVVPNSRADDETAFTFDHAMDSTQSQNDIYEAIGTAAVAGEPLICAVSVDFR